MFELNAKFDADSLLYCSVILNVDGHTVHVLTQQLLPPPLTSTVKSSLFMHVHSVHSPWLPHYTDVMQTVLVILTMAGLFLDRPQYISYIIYIALT